ncbi:MAG: long-chain fatty acid--CoA ligase [Bacteroidota bacterium]|nr:long-chain fatty acid--CoA ligase [Bacteroidota bacterium]
MDSDYRIFDILNRYKTTFKDKSDAFGYKEGGVWKTYSAAEYIEKVNQVSTALLSLGIKKDDKIATVISNSPEWNFIDMGLQQVGAVHVPIYPTISIENFKHIFADADVKALFFSDSVFYDFIKPAINEKIEYVVCVDDKIDGVDSWSEFLDKGKNIASQKIEQIKATIVAQDVMSIIYTSGTTGTPKGVMLTHRNFVSNFYGCVPVLWENPIKTALSFLPLCHVYERMLGYVYQYEGISVYYVKSINLISESLKEVKPEMFCSVPRVLEKSYDKIVDKARDLPLLSKMIFYWALGVAEKFDHHTKKSLYYKFQLKLADFLVYKNIRAALGGKMKLVVSGGAVLQSKISRTFWAAGIDVMEGYGLTETSPVIAVSTYDNGIKIGTVGLILKGVEVKFADDGEILCKGPNVMKGYYNNPEQTAEIIDAEGWLHTGDIGRLEDGKYLRITDRKKEMFKTSGGKYVAPQVVESKIKESPFIDNIIVVGENQRFTGAIIVPNMVHFKSWCKIKNIAYSSDIEMVKRDVVINRVQKEVDKYNKNFDKVDSVKAFYLVSDEWSVATNELSPTLKLKRKVLHKKYTDLINEMYSNGKE